MSEVFRSTMLVAPGTLTVATSFTHPARGRVDCPAHSLLAASTRRIGLTPNSGALPAACLNYHLPQATTTVFAVSYEKPEGGHHGLALAAHGADPTAMAIAGRQIASWRAVLRTRRLLYVTSPTTVSGADGQMPGTAVPAQVAVDAAREPVDASWKSCGCPSVGVCPATRNAHQALRRFTERGDEVVVVGSSATGPAPWAPQSGHGIGGQPVAVRTPQEAATVTVADPDRLAFVVTPGSVVAEVAAILKVLRQRYPRLRGQHPAEWCYTMENLHTAVASALSQSDTLLVTGHGSSPAVRTAVAQAAQANVTVHDVTTAASLLPQDIDVATITLVDATPDGRGRREIGQAMNGLGPTSHIRREVHSYPEPFLIPQPSTAR
ncbi:4-hydroxy-3-methylbut-2-enyl diphosphate reductase [Streptomyces acidicola]|uniref:4-hydroxy-3-methylbut-2-enyl diphosphate reductase n=1 Tax=Streptomyces acidicola TaxID=2596892 RepID=UPI003795FE2B